MEDSKREIDNILTKPIIPVELYRGIRDSQLVGLWLFKGGNLLKGLPVIAIGVGLSTYDKASVHYYVQSHIQMNEYQDRVLLPSATKKHGRPTAPPCDFWMDFGDCYIHLEQNIPSATEW
ncbi:hypothetical protein Bca52824_035751 [Brassica carinata]|uniref:Uncharacterized protein n=1 Tax=Brassica carinata TaxID=52824 RepID=A0A8X7V204_BRACI|nr:hypothetical protein Bca52824_035751 [Brassica carinata]